MPTKAQVEDKIRSLDLGGELLERHSRDTESSPRLDHRHASLYRDQTSCPLAMQAAVPHN